MKYKMDWSTNIRKRRSNIQPLKITYFLELDNPNFQVNVLGSTKFPYQLYFFKEGVECNCMDFKLRHRICKHLFFIIGKVSGSTNIFDKIKNLEDFTPMIIQEIKDNLKNKIDLQKQEKLNGNSNLISIERDDYCSICMDDFENQKNLKCHECLHVFHQDCLKTWWTTDFQNQQKCPMCRSNAFQENNPWEEFKN